MKMTYEKWCDKYNVKQKHRYPKPGERFSKGQMAYMVWLSQLKEYKPLPKPRPPEERVPVGQPFPEIEIVISPGNVFLFLVAIGLFMLLIRM